MAEYPAKIERRIFIVGAPRSGTTLVQSLLAAHSRTTSFTESHFFSRHFRAAPSIASAILLRDPRERIQEFLAENQVERSELVDRLFEPPARGWLPARTNAATDAFLQLLDQLALERRRPVWIEKTPRHLRYAPFIQRRSHVPTSFVHVVRNGLDVVSSLHQASKNWERAYSLDDCVRRWNEDVAFSLKRARTSTDAVVFYEDLTANPETALKRLADELSLDWQPEMLARYRSESTALLAPGESWKTGVSGEIRPSHASRKGLSEPQRAHVLRALRQEPYQRLREIRAVED